ncbi:hypothetical protein SUGI_0878830 [Cryptomeria japonica]|nr:hypothetical protein SUGI_0878830 [Cryptomeria japonica]
MNEDVYLMNMFLEARSKANKMVEVSMMEAKDGDRAFGRRRGFLSSSCEENVDVKNIEKTTPNEKRSKNVLTPIKKVANGFDKSTKEDIPLEGWKPFSSSFVSNVVALGANFEPVVAAPITPLLAFLDEAPISCSIGGSNLVVVFFDVLDSLHVDSTSWLGSSLVGRFCGNHPNIDTVKKWIHRIWKISGKVKISTMLNSYFHFLFSCQEDNSRILYEGPWFLGSNSLCLQNWSPGFNPWEDKLLFPIWVQLPGLPLEFWNENIFKITTSSFGEYSAMEKITKFNKGLIFARFCVLVEKNHSPYPDQPIL